MVAGDPADGRFLVAYRKGRTLVGALSFGLPPKTLRPWRAAVAARADWTASTQPP
ncbi:hypothetical protein GA0115252_10796 [Streptomyces sp. DfronAA-171]|nr:hypothetical protein GA0115252_10796 [Streptomyces sp. DfronAA-171]